MDRAAVIFHRLHRSVARWVVACAMAGVLVAAGGGAPAAVFAASDNELEYVPLVYIPGVSGKIGQGGDMPAVINQLFLLLIWALVVVAVVMVAFYGLTWVLSEVVPEKVDAKRRIGEILFGLALVMGTAILLATVNPNILNLSVLSTESLKAYQVKTGEVKLPPEKRGASAGGNGVTMTPANPDLDATPSAPGDPSASAAS